MAVRIRGRTGSLVAPGAHRQAQAGTCAWESWQALMALEMVLIWFACTKKAADPGEKS